ncbi:hypothetical protein BGZ89_003561 [Linnemannia elongata]|nr:hypothetical protein BGZ89_003561 [Linnemannia elongata]
MHAIQSRLQPFDYGLLSRFGTHPTLTHLTLAAVEKPSQDDIFIMLAILKNCPSSLRSLCLRCDYSSKDSYDRLAELHAAILERKHPWRVFESLEHLEISWDPEGCQSWVHLPILRNSPKLTHLFIGSDKPAVIVADFHIGDMQKVLQATRIFCPNIRQFGGRFAGYPDLENDLVRLIQAYPKGLKSLDVALNMSVQNLFIPALLPISATTLECLRLTALQIEVESADIIVYVLKECSNLRELSLSFGLSLDELLQNPWASHHLEMLHIKLCKPDYHWTPWLGNDLIDDDQYLKLATEILELYRKVKAHSKAGFSARFPCLGYRMPHDVAMELIGHEITEQQLLSMDLGWPSTKGQCDPWDA